MRLYAHKLREAGFTVETANSGAAALAKVNGSRTGQFDFVLTDIVTENGWRDGLELLQALKNSSNADVSLLPVVIFTGLREAGLETQCMDLGAAGFLLKPLLVMNELRTILTRARTLY